MVRLLLHISNQEVADMPSQIEKTIDLRAPPERVWLAVSDSTQFGAWFGIALTEPFAVGQPARSRITNLGYEHVVWEATVVAMDAPRLFAFTWRPYAVDPAIDYSQETPTLVEFRLSSIETGTRLTITESGFDNVPGHRRDEAMRMNDRGWMQQIENIRGHVER
jgi:uncharacterized protein YndB with AHSA1/START domain